MNEVTTPDPLLLHHADTDSASLQRHSSLRIELITETYRPEINGVSMTLGRLVAGMQQRGHRLSVIRPRQSSDPKNGDFGDRRDDVEHIVRPGMAIPRYHGLRLGFPSSGYLRKRWQRQPPDLVHIATEGPLGRSALHTARSLGIPVTSGFHTNFHSYTRDYGFGWMSGLVLGYLRRFHNRTAATLVPSPDLCAELAAQGFENLRVVGRGVDTQLFNPAHRDQSLRRSWGADDDTLVCLHVGRMAPEKNIDLAIAAFRRLRLVQPKVLMVITGDGPERKRLAKEHADIIIAPAQSPEDVARFYASADLFLFPSMSETYGNVAAEAMASGLPTLAFDYAAPRKLISDGRDGFLVPFGDTPAFGDRACQIVRDLSVLRQVGIEARRTAEKHGWAAVLDRFEAILAAAALRQPLPDFESLPGHESPQRTSPALAVATSSGD